MHDDHRLVTGRVERVLRERVRPAVYSAARALDVAVWQAPGEPVPVAEGLAAAYEPAAAGRPWGPPWSTTWLRIRGRVPAEWAGRTVEAVLELGFSAATPGFQAEGLVYRADGAPVKGLHPRNAWVRIADAAAGGEDVELYVEAAANPVVLGGPSPFAPTPLGRKDTAGTEPLYRLDRLELAVFERDVWELVQDLEVLTQLLAELAPDRSRHWDVLRALDRAVDALDLHDVPGTAAAARGELAAVLATPAAASAHRISAVGHAHIDSAWLWPLRETVRKVARTTANVTDLLERHDGLVYAMSSAQQFDWIREHRPEVYQRVVAKVADGRFVPVGGMWVESDTNLPGGEAMARQFVHGKRFFLDEFGVETEEVWLPDSFGYSAALPQLVALSRSRWFLTQKISWSQTNKFPHHTFWWEGLDGTRVFTHFPPVDTYTAELSGREVAHAEQNFAEKGRATRSLVPFGYGDGGGGPTREMLARAARLADLDGSPRVALESPRAFFEAAQREYTHAPVWVGELYLEFHRGTYTSQARTKEGNRRCEHLLREAELWCATAAVRHGFDYPHDRLDRIWKAVLLNQFHDILPGSSIAWVHREAEATYRGLIAELEEIIASALAALSSPGGPSLTFNAAPHGRDGVPALGAAPAVADGTVSVTAADGNVLLDNGILRVTVDAAGLITSVRDLPADREVIAPGRAANLLQLHPDHPNQWDAWDVDSFYRNKVTDLVGVDAVTPLDSGVRITRSFGESTVTQTIALRPGARSVELTTDVDWHESEKFLKLAFPLDVQADRSAAETQFGHVFRPTHDNTSWDAARFEICAHRFLHVAEPGYGVALANDRTYGHDVSRAARDGGGIVTTVRASLLRAPRFPDPDTDHGRHVFRHALVPGVGVDGAVEAGYRLNLPSRTGTGGPVAPLVAVADPAVVVESVKLADDGSGAVVVRLYEALGGRARTRLRAGFPVRTAESTDLLERPWPEPRPLPVHDDEVDLSLRPFEILTLRLA